MKKISFDIANGEQEINFSKLLKIDEEGLLPGTHEARTTCGSLSIQENNAAHLFQFAALTEQHALQQLELKSSGVELAYTLSENNHLLTATRGAHGPSVFTASIDDHGQYTFHLHEHIDRQSPANLVNNSDLTLNEQQLHPLSISQDLPGWQIQTSTDNSVAIMQNIATEPLTTYQLTFYHEPHTFGSELDKIQLYWDNQLIYTLDATQPAAKGYTFSVEGNAEKMTTPLQFMSVGNDDLLSQNLHQISVTSTAQHQLPLDFFVSTDNSPLSSDHFTVNVTTTPSLQLNNQIPFDVIVEQGVYQTIIVNDQHTGHDPLNTILLEPLFNNLSIPTENRQVEVVQRLEDNGLATNVYEVKITDKTNIMPPITIADVQLSFPGGDGGLGVFHQNVVIDDGSDPVPLPHYFS